MTQDKGKKAEAKRDDEPHPITFDANIAKSVEQGYETLKGTFSPHQANIAQKFNLGEGIETLVVNWLEIHGDVRGNVTQIVGSQTTFSQHVANAFKNAYNMVGKKEDVSPEQKKEIVRNLKTVEEELQSEEHDLCRIQKSWKWIKENASWVVPTLATVVTEGIKIAIGV